MQILAAICMACSASFRAGISVLRSSAVAAAIANGPPEPMAATLSSGSITSPVPLTMYMFSLSATSSSASRCRSTLSVRHSLASSTTERARLPLNCSSLDSKRENSEKASAVEPANPARILSLYSRRSFFAELLRTSWPMVTWPSPAITTLPLRRTQITVVERIFCFMGASNFIVTQGGKRGANGRGNPPIYHPGPTLILFRRRRSRARSVQQHPHFLHGDQAAPHHRVERGQEVVDLFLAIHDFNDQRKVFGEPQDLSRVQTAGVAESHRPTQDGRAAQMHFARFENDGLVKGPVLPPVVLSDEDP